MAATNVYILRAQYPLLTSKEHDHQHNLKLSIPVTKLLNVRQYDSLVISLEARKCSKGTFGMQ
jgi:hypothetical protein